MINNALVKLVLILCTFMVFLLFSPQALAQENEEQSILEVIQYFFDTMAAQDAEGARTTMLPGALFVAVSETAGEFRMRTYTKEDYLLDIPEGLKERIWDAEIRVQGRIASAWTPYDFHINNVFSHCGVNNFNLVKSDEGWKIAGVVYTVERTDCPESPLGPPGVGNG